jgi:hypothetical protein
MQLTLHDSYRAWKGFDWETLDRLYEKRWIENPRSRAKSVVLTEEGLANSARLFQHYLESQTKNEMSRRIILCRHTCRHAGS